MVAQPSGTVTLVFTDVEGSTRLLQELGRDAYLAALHEQQRIVRAACARHDGYEVDTAGDGFLYAFASAGEAVAAAEEAMAALAETTIRVRAGIHTGEPRLDPPKYVGQEVHKAARIMSAGHGGQVLLSQSTRGLVDGVEVRDLGDHRLKDFDEPVRLFQLGRLEFPPLKTLSNTNLPVPASSFVGRERELADVDVPPPQRWRATGHSRRARRLRKDATCDRSCRRRDRRLPGRRGLGRPREPARLRAGLRHDSARRSAQGPRSPSRSETAGCSSHRQLRARDRRSRRSLGVTGRMPQPPSPGDEPRAAAAPGRGRVPGAAAGGDGG